MIQSMTGFGRVQHHSEEAYIQVEIRTLNSKQSDTYLKIPSIFYHKEIELKKLLSNALHRGKITLSLEYTPKNAQDAALQINHDLAKAYYQQLKELSTALSAQGNDAELFSLALNMPDIMVKPSDSEVAEKRYQTLLPLLNDAIQACIAFRRQEGEAMQQDLFKRIAQIEQALNKIDEQDPQRIARLKERLHAQIAEWENNEAFDKNRFEQELIYYIEKLDISEEKVRLRNHLAYFSKTLHAENTPQLGKKLGFISQEIGREINTIGSKANDASIQHLVVTMKEELEKIKELVLNVL